MDVPLWFAVLVVAVLGIQLARPPWWLVALLLLGGYLVANSVLAPAVATLLRKVAQQVGDALWVPPGAPDADGKSN
ncbi:hypothetical protein U5640_24055 [Streptomyces sp. SS7]|uniref:hypothetical protein n=1 Tax=Streptomyces sp. SS7 TaxID=3108485 RepID=UPI0030EF9E6B